MKSYNVSCDVPEPILLNCWKHHAGFIKSKIAGYRESSPVPQELLREETLLIGGSLMDLYLGKITPSGIARSITAYMNKQSVTDLTSYSKWLREEGKDFREIEIEDHSRWTLRFGERKGRFIHIHPSRYSPQTIRVRSSSLKSAILFCTLYKEETENMLTGVNRIRREFLDLPPLKNVKSGSALFELVKILS